jgi:hypothetical protein
LVFGASRNVILTDSNSEAQSITCYKAKHIHKSQTHLLVRVDVTSSGQMKKILAVSLKGLGAKTN